MVSKLLLNHFLLPGNVVAFSGFFIVSEGFSILNLMSYTILGF